MRELEREIELWHRSCEVSRRLQTIPGIGPMTAGALVASAGDPAIRRTGMQDSSQHGLAWCRNRTPAAAKRSCSESASAATSTFTAEQISALKLLKLDMDASETLGGLLHSYVSFAQRNKGIFALMLGPKVSETIENSELDHAGQASFDLFADVVAEMALACGWPRRQVKLIVHTAWAVEHGLAALILTGRAPSRRFELEIGQMIDFSVDMLLSAIAAGPVGLETIRSGRATSSGRRELSKVA